VRLLKKSFYGLKQAPRNWIKTITAGLEEYGFSQSMGDFGIYVFIKEGELYVLALYVDDNVQRRMSSDQRVASSFGSSRLSAKGSTCKTSV
jgi:hypothetical protein